MSDDASTGIVVLMCAGQHLFILDNFLLYMDAPTNQPFICGSLSILIRNLLEIACFRVILF